VDTLPLESFSFRRAVGVVSYSGNGILCRAQGLTAGDIMAPGMSKVKSKFSPALLMPVGPAMLRCNGTVCDVDRRAFRNADRFLELGRRLVVVAPLEGSCGRGCCLS
jgi:hypothetical protein